MKKLLLLFFVICSAKASYGQLVLRYGGNGPVLSTDKVRMGDTFSVQYYIVNASSDSSVFKAATIWTFISTPKDSSVLCDTSTGLKFVPTLNKGDSAPVIAVFRATTQFFDVDQSAVIVVWPTGGGTENQINKRQIAKTLYIDHPISIEPVSNDLNRVSFYPNPFRDQATIKLTSNRSHIDNVTIVNMQGQEMLAPVLRNGQMDLSYLQGGLYLMKVHFSNGAVSVFRISKR
jgi:hypothetical protein